MSFSENLPYSINDKSELSPVCICTTHIDFYSNKKGFFKCKILLTTIFKSI